MLNIFRSVSRECISWLDVSMIFPWYLGLEIGYPIFRHPTCFQFIWFLCAWHIFIYIFICAWHYVYHLYVSSLIYMHACLHAYIHIHTYVHTYVRTYIHTYVHTLHYRFTFTFTSTFTSTFTFIFTFTFTFTFTLHYIHVTCIHLRFIYIHVAVLPRKIAPWGPARKFMAKPCATLGAILMRSCRGYFYMALGKHRKTQENPHK